MEFVWGCSERAIRIERERKQAQKVRKLDARAGNEVINKENAILTLRGARSDEWAGSGS